MSHFSWPIDGSIVGLYLLVTMVAGLSVRKYVGKVEHFLVAGREMDVYLGIASLAATEFGIVTCMYSAELGYKHGFAGATAGITYAAAMFLVGYTGFCVKKLRDSGVMTIAELFDQRFGPRIRWWSGLVIVLGGLLEHGHLSAAWAANSWCWYAASTSAILEIAMTIMLVAVAIYTIVGGMLSVLVTDLSAIHRDERRPAGRHVSDAENLSLEHLGVHRRETIMATVGSIRFSIRSSAGRTSCSMRWSTRPRC